MRTWLRQHRQAFAQAVARFARSGGLLSALVIGVALSLPAGSYALLESLRSVAARLSFEPQISVFLAPAAKRAEADALGAARARGVDVVLADTAGRLPTQLHLMEEIRKVKRVAARAQAGAPHEVLLVLDANTGQNALAQVKAFDDALRLTGLVITKLDGTAKGGVICAIAKERPVPVLFVGIGEGIDDLRPFVAREFAEAMID